MTYFDYEQLGLAELCRAMGLLGFFLYAGGFFCLSTGRIHSSEPRYFVLVFAASSCVLVSLWADFNLSAALIQTFYLLMSLGGILLRRGRPLRYDL
ncbi:MAG: hypothetical protein AAF376_08650 [Pseudomonadota bacterium]